MRAAPKKVDKQVVCLTRKPRAQVTQGTGHGFASTAGLACMKKWHWTWEGCGIATLGATTDAAPIMVHTQPGMTPPANAHLVCQHHSHARLQVARFAIRTWMKTSCATWLRFRCQWYAKPHKSESWAACLTCPDTRFFLQIANLNEPRGVGDKAILRQVAVMLGLPGAANLAKRAMHFGSRIAKQSNVAHFGSNRQANGKATFHIHAAETRSEGVKQ